MPFDYEGELSTGCGCVSNPQSLERNVMKKTLTLFFASVFLLSASAAFAWPKLPKGFKFKAGKVLKYRFAAGDYGVKNGLGVGITYTFRTAGPKGGTITFKNVKALLASPRVSNKDKKFFRALRKKMHKQWLQKRTFCRAFVKRLKRQQIASRKRKCGLRAGAWLRNGNHGYTMCIKRPKRHSQRMLKRRARRLLRCSKRTLRSKKSKLTNSRR